MDEKKNIYFSLDEARNELRKRWNDDGLKKAIEEKLGNKFMPQFKNEPRGIVFRQICSADNGFELFFYAAKYINAKPLILEYHDDIFTHMNEEKKGLGRLRVVLKNGMRSTVDIMDFHASEKQRLGDVAVKTGEKLVDFHHNLFSVSGYEVDFLENSMWFHGIGRAADYYYYLLLHFVAHGALFETFSLDEREKGEAGFVENIVLPNIDRIKKEFGINPIIVRDYPENQTDEEDFYWWCYPPQVNDHIIDYAKENNLPLKDFKI